MKKIIEHSRNGLVLIFSFFFIRIVSISVYDACRSIIAIKEGQTMLLHFYRKERVS